MMAAPAAKVAALINGKYLSERSKYFVVTTAVTVATVMIVEIRLAIFFFTMTREKPILRIMTMMMLDLMAGD